MKEFRKTLKGLFICEECGKTFVRVCGLSLHIKKKYIQKEYYDKWLKEENEELCKYCGKETKYVGYWHKKLGYYKYCCEKCRRKGRINLIQTTCIKKYNVKSAFCLNATKEKKKKTYLKHYGVDHNMKSRKGFEENFKSRILIKKYKNTDIWYQGSYEFDFLEKFLPKFSDIVNGPSIKYGKNKIYHPDFYIPLLNLIVEIKNSYLAKRDKEEIEAKEKATIANGFKYIMIVDENYDLFIT